MVIHFSALQTPFPTCQERALEVPTLTSACSEPATACGRLLCLYLRASLINLINQPVLVQRCEAPCSCPWPLCGRCPQCDPHPRLGACGKWERCENHPNSAKFLLLCVGQGWALLDQRLAGLRSCFLMPVAGNGLGGTEQHAPGTGHRAPGTGQHAACTEHHAQGHHALSTMHKTPCTEH